MYDHEKHGEEILILFSQNRQKQTDKTKRPVLYGVFPGLCGFMSKALCILNKDNKNQHFCVKRKLKPNYSTNYAISLYELYAKGVTQEQFALLSPHSKPQQLLNIIRIKLN